MSERLTLNYSGVRKASLAKMVEMDYLVRMADTVMTATTGINDFKAKAAVAL